MAADPEDVELLVPADLPAGWQMPAPSPIDPERDSREIDAALRYAIWVDSAPGLDRKLATSHNRVDEGRWYLIQHLETNTRVLLHASEHARDVEHSIAARSRTASSSISVLRKTSLPACVAHPASVASTRAGTSARRVFDR